MNKKKSLNILDHLMLYNSLFFLLLLLFLFVLWLKHLHLSVPFDVTIQFVVVVDHLNDLKMIVDEVHYFLFLNVHIYLNKKNLFF